MPKKKRTKQTPKRKGKRKRTAAEKRARREWKKTHRMIFVNGKQKWVKRPPEIDGLPVDEFIARNADLIWLHENELWELMPNDEENNEALPNDSIPF